MIPKLQKQSISERGEQNGTTHFCLQTGLPWHFSLLANEPAKPTEEKVGGGLRHLCNRAPKFQQVGDFRER